MEQSLSQTTQLPLYLMPFQRNGSIPVPKAPGLSPVIQDPRAQTRLGIVLPAVRRQGTLYLLNFFVNLKLLLIYFFQFQCSP